MPHIVVIGAGVIGLSAALRILGEEEPPSPPQQQETQNTVTIVARDYPEGAETVDGASQIDFTSAWGGAHNRLVPPTDAATRREHGFARRTFARVRGVRARHPEAGVTLLRGVEYLEAGALAPAYRDLTEARARDEAGPDGLGMRGFRLLPPAELPPGVAWGCEYDTWCVNPMVYCAWMLRRFALRGGRAVRRAVRDPREVLAWRLEGGPVDAVVNASGQGFGDERVFVTRGQTCLVANPCPVTITRQNSDGSWTFCVPRAFDGGTVIGGTKEPDNWDPHPSPAVREALLRRFADTYPAILGPEGRFAVIRDVVGRRPTRRGGMRLEAEVLDADGDGDDDGAPRPVVHAYGLGGRGYELSWGVADEVAALLQPYLEAKTPGARL
ncbi:FAD dependent oxidoreductase [Durotheca rogersii]|uniref:FAD dependent oxidoreductase n=1 Tax=Durotheca rogersii TaxID=419775 RepID=UPI00221F588B|nr:FAD dependent oxidoreductase [Durotheca rogersii]KAI5864876.1 FAD dependent oxidoreductase [Durotheca rogersii]